MLEFFSRPYLVAGFFINFIGYFVLICPFIICFSFEAIRFLVNGARCSRYKIPSVWSYSCCIIRAVVPLKDLICFLKSGVKYSMVISHGLFTDWDKYGMLKQPS